VTSEHGRNDMTRRGDRFLARVLWAWTAVFLCSATIVGVQSAPDDTLPITLQIIDNTITGAVVERPLADVIGIVAPAYGLEYEGYPDVLAHPVSGRFDHVPLDQALAVLLEPFNYVLDGERSFLNIISVKSGYAAARMAPFSPVPRPHPSPRTSLPVDGTPPDGQLLTPVRLLDGMELPANAMQEFEPWQVPGTEDTGPPLPAGVRVRDLPAFDQLSADFDDGVSANNVVPLPAFTPIELEAPPTR
jgi:hypothetical protein